MTAMTTSRKVMTGGEMGSVIAFAALAFFSIFVAANAHTSEYAFHAYLFAAGSAAAVAVLDARHSASPGYKSARFHVYRSATADRSFSCSTPAAAATPVPAPPVAMVGSIAVPPPGLPSRR